MNDILTFLFPDAPDGSWFIQDDGAGPYIKEWHLPDPQPTPAEIEAARPMAEMMTTVTEIEARYARIFASLKDRALVILAAGGSLGGINLEWETEAANMSNEIFTAIGGM